jgi:hypothetical protein
MPLYNFNMIQNILLVLLAIYMLVGFVLALFYMRHRGLTRAEFAFWGMLALFLPVIGPFFVIAARPGPRKRSRRPHKSGG